MVRLRRSIDWLLAQLLPPACPLCRVTFPVDWGEIFCPACLSGFRSLPEAHCPCCALPFPASDNSGHLCGRCLVKQPSFKKVHAVGLYDRSLRDAIHQFKFNRRIGLDRPLAMMLERALTPELKVDLIVPVPLHFCRLQQRNFNQALLLARELARKRELPVAVELLVKTVETAAQQELSAREREHNLHQAFRVQGELHGERVLLVDDVMTTGATVEGCCRTLLDAGAATVEVAVIGRA